MAPRVVAAVAACVIALGARTARAWNYVEHLALGSESYTAACEHLRAELAGSTDAGVVTRLGIACDNLAVAAELYGQSTALAGDRFNGPADFMSTSAGWKASSRKQYLGLALANSTHFHPYAPREWRRYHARAVTDALAGARMTGLDAVDALQAALFENAFADHFLHDSFSAGHMGFNRSASSVAASLAYHDEWNHKGRTVRDRNGASWRTYGDGRLDHKDNVDGRVHAVTVATLSIEGLLRAFVVGARDADNELAIWRSLPFVIEAPDLPSLTDRILGLRHATDHSTHPLGAINWPAKKDRMFDARMLVTGTFDRRSPVTAVLAGYHVSLPLISTRVHVGVGATIPHGTRGFNLAADIGVTAEIGLTNDGVLDHQLTAGAMVEARETIAGSVWGGYLLNVELGRSLIQIQVGPAFISPERELGFAVGIGFARVLSAAGGGVR